MPPLSLKVVWGPPFFISFFGFTYNELQVYKLLPKSECRFYVGGMALNCIILKVYQLAIKITFCFTTLGIYVYVCVEGGGARGGGALFQNSGQG